MDNQQSSFQPDNVKEENANSVRLQSFKLPRDLSLGGTKRKFTPNLNAVRNKNKPREMSRKTGNKRFSRDPETGHRNRNSGRYVQTAGVFSEGTAATMPRPRQTERAVNYKERDTVATMLLPKISRDSWNVNKSDEKVVIDNLIADSESDSEEEDIYQPVVMESPATGSATKLQAVQKTDVSDYKQDYQSTMNATNSAFLNSEKYSDTSPCYTLFKLPDSFAGKGGLGDVKDDSIDYRLKDMLEGQVGKLVIRKSGRMEAQIGRISYEFESMASSDSREELMFLEDDNNAIRKTAIANMGPVQEQYLFTPTWDSIIKR